MQPFRRALVTEPLIEGFRPVLADGEVMLVTILDALLDRFERHADYPFVDTKLSILTGQDFPEPADASRDFRGRSAVFSWIQGRGLEALAGHARWLGECSVLGREEKSDRLARIRNMVAKIFDRMESIRASNAGRLSFMMTPEGEPFDVDDSGRRRRAPVRTDAPANSSDLFYVKGMLAASLLGQCGKIGEAKRIFRQVLDDIRAERFESDQVAFDPRNKVAPVPGRLAQAPSMIAVGGCALFAELLGEEEWLDAGAERIAHLLDTHANLGQFEGLELYDFFEFRGADRRPWREGSCVRSDPGHSLEFVGLATKLLMLIDARGKRTPKQQRLLAKCREVLPKIFMRNFRNGFNARIGGICKGFDLVSRKPMNDQMPWWNLPETMRAAAELLVFAPDAPERADILEAFAGASNGFMTRFVNPDVHLMAFQTIDSGGRPVDVIPATPDADPGYHTGLSLIDVLRCFARL